MKFKRFKDMKIHDEDYSVLKLTRDEDLSEDKALALNWLTENLEQLKKLINKENDNVGIKDDDSTIDETETETIENEAEEINVEPKKDILVFTATDLNEKDENRLKLLISKCDLTIVNFDKIEDSIKVEVKGIKQNILDFLDLIDDMIEVDKQEEVETESESENVQTEDIDEEKDKDESVETRRQLADGLYGSSKRIVEDTNDQVYQSWSNRYKH